MTAHGKFVSNRGRVAMTIQDWMHDMPAGDISGLVDVQRDLRPDSVFIRFGDGSVTWNSLAERRDAFAAMLSAEGIGSGDRVVIQSVTSLNLVYLMLGVWRVGAVAVMSNPANTQRELDAAVAATRPRMTVIDDGARVEGEASLRAFCPS